MKKLFALLVVAGMCFACTPKAEPAVETETDMEQVDENAADENVEIEEAAEEVAE
jgi:hypothetical protein